MFIPECSYWIRLSGPADKLETAAAMVDAMPVIFGAFTKGVDEDDGDICYEVTFGTIAQWHDFAQEMGKIAAANPDIRIEAEEIDEETHSFHRLYRYADGVLKETHFGRLIDPEEFDNVTIRHCMDILRGAGYQEAAQYLNDHTHIDD